ncbi:MAG: S41 family peptidase [Anaerolineae bacterium]|nr:S41 family peptidase [Anaerolineae bacterium]
MHKHYASEFRRSLLIGVAIGLVLALVFAAGFFARDFITLAPGIAAPRDSYPLLDEVQGLLDRHFLREQPPQDVREYAAIRGVLSALNDRFTFFIEPPVAASESDALAGTYGGIGVQIKRNQNGDIELYPYDDSPAQKAGIANGDILLAVNGEPLSADVPQDSIDQMMRGEVKDGSGVELSVRRVANGAEFTQFIAFEVINVPSVIWRVLPEDAALGYVQITRFTGRTPDELKTALADLTTSDVRALVLDLRNNTGGLLDESIQVANAFVEAGPLVYQIDNSSERVFEAQPGNMLTDLPLVVLVNNYTASGAELVAGAIQDDQRGVLIGQKTYGKGTVQQIFPLSDKSSLHVTSAEWLTPLRHALDTVGLEPDIAMIPDAQGRDVELGEAVRYLQGILQETAMAGG